ncbi:hypothetical protein BZA77DRAFT_370018 [Pyronema omphalodes]|nr:hypothetical protein BZA77DRAFT_370018 [Pyronema omphalodes]
MGGFVIDTSKESYDTDTRPEPFRDVDFIKFKPRQKSKFNATLTPTGFVKYLHDGYFDFHNPPFKKREIIDKGKASNIAKLLSAVQAFWLAVQCAGRRAAGLKLCLLEIHILIQVACTALIFWFWWHKPLDVNEPIYLDLKDAEGNTIKPIQDIENTRFETSTGEPSPTEESPQLTLEGSTTGLQSPGHIGGSASGDVSTRISGNSATDANSSAESPTTTVGSPSNRIFPEHLSISTETSHNQMGDHLNVPDLNSNAMSDTYSISEQGTLNEKLPFLKNEILKRLLKEEHVRLGDALIPDHEAVRPSMELQQHIHPWRRLYTITRTPSGRIGVSDRALHDILFYVTGGTIDDTTLDFSNEEQKARRGHMRRISRMFLENMFIGALAGLHALAWNAEFPTPLERYLWRFSCVGMFVFPIPAVAVAAVRDYHMDIAKIFWNNHTVARYNCWQWVVHAILCIRSLAEVNSRVGTTDQIKKGKLICHYIFLIVAILLLGCYLFCISYITWESYSSMRYPPETTFTTPVWTDYWPKLG